MTNDEKDVLLKDLCAMESKCCYMCQYYVGPLPNENDFDTGEGMCPFTSVYTNAYDEVCGKEILFDEYKN